MILLDTSIWIEFLKANPIVYSAVSYLLEERLIVTIECIFGELLQGVKNKKERRIIEDYWRYLPKLEINDLFIEAGSYSAENKLISKGIGLIDSVILVTAIRNNAKVWTLDKKLITCLPSNHLFPKPN